jgi:hypothetical protein
VSKLTVLLSEEDDERFDAYCRDRGYKKSPLVARLIREHLIREGFAAQRGPSQGPRTTGRAPRRRSRG